MEYVLKTKNLSKSYNNVYAVDNVNMNVIKGSIYGFVGRNGAGKTTLFRMVSGLARKTSGEISLFGSTNENELIQARKRLTAVVETPAIYPALDAYSNLKIQCLQVGIDTSCIEEVLKIVGLENVGKKKAKNFSLGIKQRLGLALALVLKPDLLMLDEPTNGLDPEGIVEFRELLIKLNKELNITILISSHILGELSKIATHYGFIKKGKLILEITNKELLEKCRKKSILKVSSVKDVPLVLSNYKDIEYKIINDNELEIYGTFNFSKLALEFNKVNIEIESIVEKNEDLESYYINLIGGRQNA